MTTLRIYQGANGYYLAAPDTHNFHHQPPSWDSGSWYVTRDAVERELARQRRDATTMDAEAEIEAVGDRPCRCLHPGGTSRSRRAGRHDYTVCAACDGLIAED